MHSRIWFLACMLALNAGFSIPLHGKQETPKSVRWENYNGFDHNPLIPDNIKQEMRPFILSDAHPLKPFIDAIFADKRVTQDSHTFRQAGFQTLAVKKRSFIRVARHPWVPGYLFKVVLDSELREKHGKPEWHWFLQRCKGAQQIREVICANSFKYFAAPQKWIYPLPTKHTPLKTEDSLPKAVVLIVEDMDIVDDSRNLQAWETKVTAEHLDELFVIIRDARGSSYRASNIPYSRKGYFAFIDTEYPNSKPDFDRIRDYLSEKMIMYWDALVAESDGVK